MPSKKDVIDEVFHCMLGVGNFLFLDVIEKVKIHAGNDGES